MDEDAKKILKYMKLGHDIKPCDVIVGLGSIETRVADRSAQLLLDGFGDLLVFSGGLGKVTKSMYSKPEAELFADVAVKLGVERDKILIENTSQNTGQNAEFSERLLSDKGIHPQSILIVTKPYMERRAYATFKKSWTDKDTEILVTSPDIEYDDYFDDEESKNLFLNIMVGDLQRIKEYPKLGYQIEQEIPNDVWRAYVRLVEAGYDKYLIN